MSSSNSNKNGKEHHTSSIWQVNKDRLADMQQKLSTQPKILSKSAGRSSCCIYRAPRNLMGVNGRSYQPQIVSIGPYHHGLEHLQMIEEHKWRFLSLLLDRIKTSKNIGLEDLLKAVQPLESRIRECYSETIDFDHDKLIEIMVLDGCFIIELFKKFEGLVPYEADDPLRTMTWIFSTFLRDFIRLENQIPFFVLDCLFKLTQLPGEEESGPTLAILTLNFFNSTLERPDNVIAKHRYLQGKHILDLLRSSFIPPEQSHTRAIREAREGGHTVMAPPKMMRVNKASSTVRTPRKAMRVNKGGSTVMTPPTTMHLNESGSMVLEGVGRSTVMAPSKMMRVNEGPSMVLDQTHTRAISEEEGEPTLMAMRVSTVGSMVMAPLKMMHVNQGESMEMKPRKAMRVNERLDQSRTRASATGGQFTQNTHLIHCVSKLRSAGISLKPGHEDSFLNIKYNRGVIEMPKITIDDFMSEFLLNCVAYEQCHNDQSTHMTTYALLLDCLINTYRDVEYLSEQNVIENYLGSDGEAAKFINDLAKYVAFGIHECYLASLFDEVNDYYNKTWHVLLESFKYTYFRTPWSFISAVAAFVLLVLTVLQTVYTIIG